MNNEILCPGCDKKFSTKKALKDHARNVHNNARFSCSQCFKQFKSEKAFRKHEDNPRVHNQCEESGELFQTQGKLRVAKKKKQLNEEEKALLPSEDEPYPSRAIFEEYPLEYRELIATNWGWIKTKHTKRNVMSMYNMRLSNGELNTDKIAEFLRNLHKTIYNSYKIQLQFG